MKIQNDESIINIRSMQKSAYEQAVPSKTSETGRSDGDQVQLSDRAREFNRIKEALETIPVARDEKVAALADAVEKGTYTADTGTTADKLIQESLIDILA